LVLFKSNFLISDKTFLFMNNENINQIERNLFLINQRINQACKIYSKNKSDVNLIAVSKKQSTDKIYQAIKFGVTNFGENYIKEAQEKWLEIKKENPQIKLHFIGNLQSNKASDAVELFDFIHSLDSQKLALELKKEIKKQQKNPEIFVQVNISEEPQKGGILPNEVSDFMYFAKNECGLNIVGLMCIPNPEERASPYFALLNKIAKKNNLKNLSMGMTADFEEAIALDANYIRIGTAIFGERT